MQLMNVWAGENRLGVLYSVCLAYTNLSFTKRNPEQYTICDLVFCGYRAGVLLRHLYISCLEAVFSVRVHIGSGLNYQTALGLVINHSYDSVNGYLCYPRKLSIL